MMDIATLVVLLRLWMVVSVSVLLMGRVLMTSGESVFVKDLIGKLLRAAVGWDCGLPRCARKYTGGLEHVGVVQALVFVAMVMFC